MKTAISLPDGIYASAERFARRLGISRSRLYAAALLDFLAKHPRRKVTEKLDEIYSHEPSALDPAYREMQNRSLLDNKW